MMERKFLKADILTLLYIFLLAGCSPNYSKTDIVNTFEETPAELIEEYIENSQMVTTAKYYELSNGTWKTDDFAYKYRLEITGRLNAAEKDTTYVILSNTDDITFEQAWKASGLSSLDSDYFEEDTAKIVAFQ